ncbi:MAG: carboxymuconolactone decarboxylase family protein [Elusimicrobia bacterium]|nr:carboxymuconolactone decarboxylase family protein [Elusimicrobiota bacterium]
MKPIHHVLLPFILSVSPLAAAAQPPAETAQAEAVYKDVQETLGSVPTFIKLFPRESVAGAWAAMKNLQLSKSTALDGRIKELIGAAVASQIPCRYCSYFHEAAAKANGASDEEMREAVAVAAIDRQWSAMVHGAMTDEVAFRKDADKMNRNLARLAAAPSTREPGMREAPAAQVEALSGQSSVEDVRRDVERVFGFYPGFMKSVPDSALPGVWLETRQLLFNPQTKLSGKEKSLIGLAISSQIPDRIGIYFHTKGAQANGASEVEMREAVAMAGATRHWSTMLNGLRVDEKQFQTETDAILQQMGKQGGK